MCGLLIFKLQDEQWKVPFPLPNSNFCPRTSQREGHAPTGRQCSLRLVTTHHVAAQHDARGIPCVSCYLMSWFRFVRCFRFPRFCIASRGKPCREDHTLDSPSCLCACAHSCLLACLRACLPTCLPVD